MRTFERKTVKKIVEIKGYSFEINKKRILDKNRLNKEYWMNIWPAEAGEGITFLNSNFQGLEIPLNIYHTYSLDNFFGRSVALCSTRDDNLENIIPKKKAAIRIHVVEHLVSALHYLGITDAKIVVEGSKESPTEAFIPTRGAGITHYVNSLENQIEKLGKAIDVIEFREEDKFIQNHKKGTAIAIAPDDELSMLIDTSDLGKINLSPAHISMADAYKKIKTHLSARPIARINGTIIYALWKVINQRGYKGICDDNYILAEPSATTQTIVSRMATQYQEGRNESVAHGVLDRFGELYMLDGRPIRGSLHAIKGNHPSVISALKYFVKEGSIYIPK